MNMNITIFNVFLIGCLLLLPIFLKNRHAVIYHSKFLLCYSVVSILSVVFIPVFCFTAKDVRNLVTAGYICRPLSKCVGIKWVVRGGQHLAKDQSHIIVSNHQSSLDVLGMFDFWHVMGKCTVVAKKALLYAGPFGLAAWLCGLVFIPRVKSDEARQIMNEAAENIKKNKTKLWVFPEGTRRSDGKIHPFKKGAFYLAINAQLPILPVVYSQYYFIDKVNKRFDQGKIIVTALPPISTEGMTLKDIDKLMEKTREVMTKTFHDVNKEVNESLRGAQ